MKKTLSNHTEKPDFKNYFKNHYKRIKEEKEKGREIYKSKTNKIIEERSFNNISDEELFDDKNKHLIEDILTKLQICVDRKCNNPRCQNLFYLYTNKKVGSTCLWGSINLYLTNIFRTFHYHNIGDLEREQIYGISLKQLFKILKKYNKNVFVIDIYRPIFDICLSNYFNELNLHFQRDFNIYPEFENKDTFIHRFLNLFDYYYDKHDIDYFKDEYDIKEFNGFDFNKKHLIYSDGSIKYIKLRLCDSSQWNFILSPYIGHNFNVVKHNETKTKSWGKFYDYFNENFFITTTIYNKITDNESFKIYYSKEEQEKYLTKFANRINDDNDFGFKDRETLFYFSIMNKNECKEILSYLSLESNSPIANNCPCNNCNIKRKEFIFNNEISKNNIKSNLPKNLSRHSIRPQKRNIGLLNFAK